MAAQVQYKTVQLTIAANGTTESTTVFSSIASTPQQVTSIVADRLANVTLNVYAGQNLVMTIDTQHFPSDGEFLDIPIDVDSYGTVQITMTNNSGAAATLNVTFKYNYGK